MGLRGQYEPLIMMIIGGKVGLAAGQMGRYDTARSQ